jgi:hypothetical protein
MARRLAPAIDAEVRARMEFDVAKTKATFAVAGAVHFGRLITALGGCAFNETDVRGVFFNDFNGISLRE